MPRPNSQPSIGRVRSATPRPQPAATPAKPAPTVPAGRADAAPVVGPDRRVTGIVE